MTKKKCSQNHYYDGLLEMCRPCYLRCPSSPPNSCTSYCTSQSNSPLPDNAVWVILAVVLLLSAIATTILLLQVLRKKRCRRHVPKHEGVNQDEEYSGTERGSKVANPEIINEVALDNANMVQKEENSDSHCNSGLPLPSTEEGTTILVTTKTVQIHNYGSHYAEENTLGLWGSVSVA